MRWFVVASSVSHVATNRIHFFILSEQVQDTRTGHDAATGAIAAQSARMCTVHRNLDLLNTKFSMQQTEYMYLQRTSKQLDRALAKAFQHLESHMHVIEATYRCDHMTLLSVPQVAILPAACQALVDFTTGAHHAARTLRVQRL